MAIQTNQNEQSGIDPATYSPRPKQLVLRPYSENAWGMGRMYQTGAEQPQAGFPEGNTVPATDAELASFDERHMTGVRADEPEFRAQLRAWHAARGFIDAASFEANRTVDGRYVGPADLEIDTIDARGFCTDDVHYVTERPWDPSLRDAFSNPVCPMAPIAHSFVESWYEYNQGAGAFHIPATTRWSEGGVWGVTWRPTFFGEVKHYGWARDENFLREFFALEVVDAAEADSEEVRRKARAGRQYTDVVGGGVVGVAFELDGVYFLVHPEGEHETLESHFLSPMRRMNSSIRLVTRLRDEDNGVGPDYDELFETLGLTDEEAAA